MAGPGPVGWRSSAHSMFVRGRLFWASYSPLALIFALRSIPKHWQEAAAWGGIALVGFIDVNRLLRGARRRSRRTVRFAKVQDAGGAVAAYLATYLLPFVSSSVGGFGDVAAYVVYFIVVFLIYVRSDMAFINPTLYVLGWRVVEATTTTGRTVLLLCRQPPAEGEAVDVVDFLDVLVMKGVTETTHGEAA